MKHLVKAAALAAGMMVFSGIGFAQCKIAVVDMQVAVTESAEGKVKATQFEARVEEWKVKIKKIQDEKDAAEKKLQSQSSIASAAVISDLNRTIKDKGTELQRMNEDAQKDVEEYRDSLLSPLMKVADELMNALSLEKNYSIVYDLSAPDSNIVYSSKECNITEDVKNRLNARSSGAAASTSTTGARGTTPAPTAPATGRGAATPSTAPATAPAAGAAGTRGTAPPAPAATPPGR